MPVTRIITSPKEAAAILREGGLVALPTETVYGLGARADRTDAIARIFEAKNRPADNPLIAHVSDENQVGRLVTSIPAHAEHLMEAFWPGPLTVVLPALESVPRILTAGLDTIAVRMPAHDTTRSVIEHLGTPVAAPSANRSGRPSPTTWEAVRDDLDGRIDAILKANPTTVGLESTVVDCTGSHPVILRPGGITLEALQQILPDSRHRSDDEGAGGSPGLRHRHYQPEAQVRWIGPFREGGKKWAEQLMDAAACIPVSGAYIGLNEPPAGHSYRIVLLVDSLEAYAHELFHFFRTCESEGIDEIHCERVPTLGLGRALTDRIDRATVDERANRRTS